MEPELDCSAKARRQVARIEHPLIRCLATGRSNWLGDFLYVITMNKIELSRFIEANYPMTGRGRPRKLLCGFGLHDADYTTKPIVDGVQLWDPSHQSWSSILKRAYSQKYHVTHPTYVGVTVCEEWHSFSAFRAWWLANYQEGWQCDKDLLVVGNKEYSPDACIYIPSWLNKFTIDRYAARGELPIGVCLDRCCGKYKSQCNNPITGKLHCLGYFATPEAAHEAWRRYKLELADQLKPDMDAIDPRIHPNVVTVIGALT